MKINQYYYLYHHDLHDAHDALPSPKVAKKLAREIARHYQPTNMTAKTKMDLTVKYQLTLPSLERFLQLIEINHKGVRRYKYIMPADHRNNLTTKAKPNYSIAPTDPDMSFEEAEEIRQAKLARRKANQKIDARNRKRAQKELDNTRYSNKKPKARFIHPK